MSKKMNEALEQVIEQVENKQSFLLEAGAGSGKTRTLIETLQHILEKHSQQLLKNNQLIACITYTNVAKDEIKERIDNNPLVLVLTIHEFLWHVMKNFQKELKDEVIEYNNTKARNPVENLSEILKYEKIDYSQYGRKFENGKITHEDVLAFSSKLFSGYSKISQMVANKFPYIFVDEYQDTEERTVELLIDHLLARNIGSVTMGFFGDSMQKIYNQGIGEIQSKHLKSITKQDNFRCSKAVIELLNKIRPELIQNAAGENLEGSITFYSCNSDLQSQNNFNKVLNDLEKKGWDFQSNETEILDAKILFLTHRGIGAKLGYQELLQVYNIIPFGRDQLFNKDELFARFILEKVEKLAELFTQKRYGEFISILGIEDYKINRHSDKQIIADLMSELDKKRKNQSIKEVLEFVFENRLLGKPAKIEEYIQKLNDEGNENKKEFYDALMSVKYSEIISLYQYIEESTPFSTKHGVKGAEFKNVLVVIDDASWNQYKFNDVFGGIKSNQGRYDRTRNLLYVCCSRAKDNLAILSLSGMDNDAMVTINKWFSQRIIDVSKLT